MLKQLMNFVPTAAKAATTKPATAAPVANFFTAQAASASTKVAPTVLNPNQVLQNELKSGAVKFTPNQPALPHFATKSWVG